MADIDLSTDGKRSGNLWVRSRNNDSAYRRIASPYTIIVNGKGPVILAMAGVHGDEFDGQVLINRLAEGLQPHDIKGTLILMPCANPMACESGQCTSPEDNGNMFRSFIEAPTFSSTELMAKAIEEKFISNCDLVLDFHTGGKSSLYEPCSVLFKTAEVNLNKRSVDVIECFDFPCLVKAAPQTPTTFITSAAQRHEVAYVAFELGGACTVNKNALAKASDGILSSMGMLANKAGIKKYNSEYWQSGGEDQYLLAPNAGLFEAAFSLGEMVKIGQTAGRMHMPLMACGSTQEIVFSQEGKVFSMRVNAKCLKGDCLAESAYRIKKEELGL